MKKLSDCRVLLVDDAKENHKLSLAPNGEMGLQLVGRTFQEGQLASVPDFEVWFKPELRRVPLSNLKTELEPAAEANASREIYAKMMGTVAGASTQTRIRFTSVLPELKVWVLQAVARLASASEVSR